MCRLEDVRDQMLCRRLKIFLLILNCSLFASGRDTFAQQPSDSISTLKVSVNLVPLRVVVRDAKGQAIGGLTKADFQLLDRDKPQVISQFSAEHVVSSDSAPTPGSETQQAGSLTARYTAYLFDDLHIEASHLFVVREAATRRFNSMSPERERVAIFTTSGQKGIDFTADRAKLQTTVARLEPRIAPRATKCPSMSFYMADLIANKGDQDALGVAAQDAMRCEFNTNSKASRVARQLAEAAAREKFELGRVEIGRTLRLLKALVQGMSKAPGQRTIVVISPGFFISDDQDQVEIMDMAIRGDVTVSALDPRGLVPGSDIANENSGLFDPHNPGKKSYELMGAEMDRVALDELAEATGGIFFRNNNDLDEGLKRVAALPEYSYVLAFSPEHSKFDGRFHKLKVTLANGSKVKVQARKGYYAPKK